MKEKDARIDFQQQELIMYVEREDGSYGPIKTGSYISANFLDDFWAKMERIRQSLLIELKDNKISPVRFYQMIHDLSNHDLAKRVGISVHKLKKHQNPESFGQVKLSLLRKYAEVFDVPIVNLLQVITVGEQIKGSMNDSETPVDVIQSKTKNPYIIITKIDSK